MTLWKSIPFLASFLTLTAQAKIDFAHQILPLLRDNCIECHTNGKHKGGLSLETRDSLLDSEAVEVGNANESILIEVLTAEDPDERMPHKADPLPAAQIALLTQWVNEGLAWEPGFTFREKKWQAPLAHRKPDLPAAIAPDENPIDRLLRAYFKENRVQPPEPISDAAFLRRAHLDLIGLLPTKDELAAFLASESPNKRSEKIAELLGRKFDYADHWMTFWNDLLRNDYAGTGFIDGGRKQITGWLYQALTENKPYDQFVRELMNPTGASEGFIKGIKWRGDVNASQVPEIQFAQNVSQIFFGENMKCASCHDSFIDDWKLEDAYGMAAIFAGKPLEMFRCDKPTGEKMDAKFLFDSLGSIDPSLPRDKRLARAAELSTSKGNGRLARTIVNRLWSRLMGRGLVEPVDMMGNRPWSEDLLDYLAWDLAHTGYDLKRTFTLITTSRIYQSAAVAPPEKSDDFIFHGPVAKRMTAEQFIDATWGITGTAPGKIAAKVARGSASPPTTIPGKWIWSAPGARPVGEKVTFTRTLKLPAEATAKIVITCDNQYTLSVNGQQIGQDDEWTSVESYDLSPALRPGTNTITIQGTNLGNAPNASALYAHLHLISEGKSTTVSTDSKWLADGKPAVEIPGDIWASSVNQAIANLLPRPADQERSLARSVRASLVNSTLLMRALGRPNREQVVTSRPSDLTTLQALELNNGAEFVNYLNRGSSKLILQRGSLIEDLYLTALSRPPNEFEISVAHEILGAKYTQERVADLLWMVLMLPEFQFIN